MTVRTRLPSLTVDPVCARVMHSRRSLRCSLGALSVSGRLLLATRPRKLSSRISRGNLKFPEWRVASSVMLVLLTPSM